MWTLHRIVYSHRRNETRNSSLVDDDSHEYKSNDKHKGISSVEQDNDY